MKHIHSSSHQEGKLLTETISLYSSQTIPKHMSFHAHELQDYVKHFIQNVTGGGTGFVGFTGLPGVGKTSHTHLLRDSTEEVLGLREKDIFFVYKKPNHEILEIGGRISKDTGNSYAVISTDHFFRSLGGDRREVMLQDIETFGKLWGNPRACIKAFRDIHEGVPTDQRIYLGSDEEKQQKKPLGLIELRTPHNQDKGKKIVIAEGVNADEWATILREKTSIQVLKILFNLSPETSLIRVLRRDHERKGYSFASILEHRLKEYYLIMKRYIEPALQDPGTIILNKRRELPPFTREEISTIYIALSQLQETYSQDNSLSKEHRAFISTLIQELQKIFGKMRGVADNELEIWRLEKILKKEQEQLLILKGAYHRQELIVQGLKDKIGRI